MVITYEQKKEFLAFFTRRYMSFDGMPDEVKPLNVLSTLEKVSMSKARRGLDQAIGDCLEFSSNFTCEEIEALNAELLKSRLVSYAEVWLENKRRFKKILKKGSITSLTDYYLLKNIRDSISVPPAELNAIDCILLEYETRK